MNPALVIAAHEISGGLRNRWVATAVLLLGGLALVLVIVGSAPVGSVGVDRLAVTIVGLSSLAIYLVPLIALLLSHDAIVGEAERGTMLLLLSYPVRRGEILLGKFIGHVAILGFATIVGYGAAGVAAALGEGGSESWRAFVIMILSSILLGSVFLALGYLVSTLVRERATAVGVAMVLWLALVVLYDLALLGALVADGGRHIGEALFSALLLANPTDAYRLLNLAGLDAARGLTGLVGVSGEVHVSDGALIASLVGWVLVPLAIATLRFHRSET